MKNYFPRILQFVVTINGMKSDQKYLNVFDYLISFTGPINIAVVMLMLTVKSFFSTLAGTGSEMVLQQGKHFTSFKTVNNTIFKVA